MPVQLFYKVEYLRLNGNVKRGGGFVGNKQLGIAGKRKRNHNALPHAAGEFVRVAVYALFRRGYADELQHLYRACAGLPPAHFFMLQYHLHDLVAYGVNRVKAGHGVLEYHGYFLAANPAHLVLAVCQYIFAVQQYFAVNHAAGILKQAHYGKACNAFAGAGFADYAQHLALIHVKAYAAHGLYLANVGKERRFKIPYR